ncbi:MAG TPA: hypothetical protein ENN76_02255, partial [Euryarchaeota archaeon]|nr:hypothetical protein [Euryarchaeota archaeon]
FLEAGKIVENYVSPNSAGTLGWNENREHGQHVACTVLGDKTPYHAYTTNDGHAMSARLIFQDIGNEEPTYVYPSPNLYQDHFYLAQYGGLDSLGNSVQGGAVLHTNSWGGAPGYSQDTALIDQYVWDNKDFLILFAAGNDGGPSYNIDNQGEAKNVVCVGSTNALGTGISTFSSRGPTLGDDRIKPDIVAPGEDVDSAGAQRNNYYYTSQGTSMATPAVAGTMLLMHEYFDQGWYPTGTQVAGNGFTPSAALLKAVALAGAVDIGVADIPNYNEGWGRIHAENSLYFAGDSKKLKVIDNTFGLLNGQSITYHIGVSDSDGAEPLKIFLVWTDYKGDPAASIRLVNDLDMKVTVPGGTTYYGNNFAGGQSITGVYSDERNNVEAFARFNPVNGVYTVTIDAKHIPYGPQPFALVVNGGLDRGYGTITIDKTVYGPGNVMNIVVEDLNNPNLEIDVLVTNSIAGDEETVTLSATGVNSGVFKGSLPITVGNVNPENGALQVSHGETITVTYQDSNPVQTATATALVDIRGPQITDVWFSDTSATATVVHWKTDENANSTLYYRQIDPVAGPWQAFSQNDLALEHDIPLLGLQPGSVYELDIASSDANGVETRDDNGGHHYIITTLSASGGTMVLYVDDDDGTVSDLTGQGFELDWINNFNAFGWSYTHWDYKILGTPSITDMNAHQMVVWVVNEGYPQLDGTDTTTLGNYIDQNDRIPRLYIAGQDIG